MATVLLDIDGVCADFVSAVLKTIHTITGVQHVEDDVTRWEITEALNLTENQSARLWYTVGKEGYCVTLAPYQDAIDGVAKLKAIAHVVVVTSPFNSKTWMSERETWIKENLQIPREDIIHTSAKQRVVGDFLVDDKTETLRAWEEAHPGGIAIQFRRPWNANDGWGGLVVSSWEQLVSVIEALS